MFSAFLGGALLGSLFLGSRTVHNVNNTYVNINTKGIEDRLDEISAKLSITNSNLSNLNKVCNRICEVLEGTYLSNLRNSYHQDLQIAQLETQFMSNEQKKEYFDNIMSTYAYKVGIYTIPRYKERNVVLYNDNFRLLKHNDFVYIQDIGGSRGCFHISAGNDGNYTLNQVSNEYDSNGRCINKTIENESYYEYYYHENGNISKIYEYNIINGYKKFTKLTKYDQDGNIICYLLVDNENRLTEMYYENGSPLYSKIYDKSNYFLITKVFDEKGKVCYYKEILHDSYSNSLRDYNERFYHNEELIDKCNFYYRGIRNLVASIDFTTDPDFKRVLYNI